MRVLRIIKGVTRMDKLRNENIRKELGILNIEDFIEQGQLRWYGHIKRMDENRLPRKFFEYTPKRPRPVGRPRVRWLDNIKTALEKRGMTLERAEEEKLYSNRQEWRKLVRQAI